MSIHRFSIILALFAATCFITVPARAIDLVDQSGNLFVFQQKLARKGNSTAQYRVGFMYERGIGVDANAEMARQWYRQAAKQGNRDAMNRLVYMEVEQTGFSAPIHQDWISQVQSRAARNQTEAGFLLAQCYQHGYGVDKNLQKAADLLYRLSAEGLEVAEVELQRVEQQNKIQRQQAARQQARKQARQPARKTQVKTPQSLAATHDPKPAKAPRATDDRANEANRVDEAKRLAAEAKRKHYEAVMRKLAEEQAKIDAIQQWAEGSEVASADDEY